MLPVRGRCFQIEPASSPDRRRITLFTQEGTSHHEVLWRIQPDRPSSLPQEGDWIEISGLEVHVLTPNRSEGKTLRWTHHVLDPRRVRGTQVRAQTEAGIREFFGQQGFLETRTPLLVRSPGMEPHIRPFRLEDGSYLPTSPEFAMKRLLAGGLEKIFQICPAFRSEPCSPTHHPEFTMLEFYRAHAKDTDLMREVEELFSFLAKKITGSTKISYQGQSIELAPPWPRLRVRDLFLEHAGVDLVKRARVQDLAEDCKRLGLHPDRNDTWDDLYFRIWLNHIEPKLPADRACFVTRYPKSQAALSVVDSDSDGSLWARRFEVYAGGIELGNAFEELTDPIEQRRRFEEDMDLREKIYGDDLPRSPIDLDFLDALAEGMPPSAGIALGVDRMIMLLADEPELEKTLWLPSYQPAPETARDARTVR